MSPTETDSGPPAPEGASPDEQSPRRKVTTPRRERAARILKAGAAVFAVIGTGIAGWMADKWIRYPSMEASQFDFSAPLWPAATLFVVAATAAGVALLWQAARRSESGEDLFAQRHRRSMQEAGRDVSDDGENPDL